MKNIGKGTVGTPKSYAAAAAFTAQRLENAENFGAKGKGYSPNTFKNRIIIVKLFDNKKTIQNKEIRPKTLLIKVNQV